MSRNRDRLGGVQQHDTSPPPQMTQSDGGGGFSFVVPTEFVELPSRGRFYPEGHPLRGEENIEIRQMTAKEEDILTSRALLKKGVALDRVIKNIIVDKRIDPESLLIGDRNAIIIAMRVSGYGHIYETKVGCPGCGTQQEYAFDLNEANIYEGENIADLNVVSNDNGTFTVRLPRTELRVVFKLLTGRHEKTFVTGMERDRKRKNEAERNITRQLFAMIVSVDDDSSPDAIKYLVENMPSMDSRQLRLAYRLAAPNVDLTQHFECNECNHTQDMEVPLSADFFWLDQ